MNGLALDRAAAQVAGAGKDDFLKFLHRRRLHRRIDPRAVLRHLAAGRDAQRVGAQVLVENGGTVVIGGIFELTETDSVTKVPLLGDLPGVGNLFKSRSKVSNKQEMLVFITPKVVADKAAR